MPPSKLIFNGYAAIPAKDVVSVSKIPITVRETSSNRGAVYSFEEFLSIVNLGIAGSYV